MKFVAISDTHNQHDLLQLPTGDCIIHSGDISLRGNKKEVEDFLGWFDDLDYKYKVMIAGNHDFLFDNPNKLTIDILLSKYPNIIYLNDSGVTLDGIKIWGSPITPWFHNWAFNRRRGDDISKHWDLIPNDTDILVTHGPPFGIGDRTKISDDNVGCVDLYNKLKSVNPKVHIFGHIHEEYGIHYNSEFNTKFINASVLNLEYNLVNEPITFNI